MASTSFPNHFFGKSATETRLFTSTLLFGVCASWMFIGFMIVQAFTYTRHYRKDSKFLKSIIYFVILLQLVEAGLESYEVYIVDSAGWGNPIAYLNLFVITVEDIQPMFASLTGFVVQCFFTWRIWVFSVAYILHPKVRILTRIVCAAIALVSALALIAGFTLGLSSVTMPALPRWFGTALSLWIISSAVADMMITICMMSLLLHAKASSSFGETRDLLSRLTQVILQTGLLTSVLALLVLPFYFRHIVAIYGLPWYILGKSYAISLLANLNARKRSNASVLHGSNNNQTIPQATKTSIMVFSPQIRRTEGGTIKSTDVSFPVSQTDSQSRSNTNMNADVSEEYKGGAEMESPLHVNQIKLIHDE